MSQCPDILWVSWMWSNICKFNPQKTEQLVFASQVWRCSFGTGMIETDDSCGHQGPFTNLPSVPSVSITTRRALAQLLLCWSFKTWLLQCILYGTTLEDYSEAAPYPECGMGSYGPATLCPHNTTSGVALVTNRRTSGWSSNCWLSPETPLLHRTHYFRIQIFCSFYYTM